MALFLNGIAASTGIAFGKAYKLTEPGLSFKKIVIENIEQELTKLHTSIEYARNELQHIRKRTAIELGEENAAIFDAHLLVLKDPELITLIEKKISSEKMNAEAALFDVSKGYVEKFEQLENQYMKERATDIKDVTKRVLAHLLAKPLPNPNIITDETILIADDLTPSETAQMNKRYVKGFVTDIGGPTSHSVIMAKSMEIPAIVGTKNASTLIKNGDEIIVDGVKGQVWINPSEEIRQRYKQQLRAIQAKRIEWSLLKEEATVTKDHHQIALAGNISSPEDTKQVLANGGEGIGLYRTEFLYMERNSLPTEEEQFEAYKAVLDDMDGKPVIIRTLDIGADKQLTYWKLPKEMNPFLGLRAIRLALHKQEVFRTQLRALLRASTYGQLKIMFPMIATVEEFRQAKKILLEEKASLKAQGIPIEDHLEVGIMIEIPATAMLADIFAKEVDFFSIGTNDLIQYTFAADRMNEQVSYLYQPYHPAILRLIKLMIDAGHNEGKWVGLCGEMAGDPIAIPLLLGLGLDEFSMNASSILPARSQLKKLSKHEMENLAKQAILQKTADEVVELVNTFVER